MDPSLDAMYQQQHQFYYYQNHNPSYSHSHNHNHNHNQNRNQTTEFTENRNCIQQEEEEEANTESVSMDIDASASESDTNQTVMRTQSKRNKHRKHWILQSGYKLHGTLSKTKYRILKCIGKGRFSHVFSAFDESKRCAIAIKVDTNPKEKELLLFEYEIMRSFANLSPYICKVYDFGKLPKDIGIGNFLCMELCHEKNLSDQRKECPSKCFGIEKGALIGVEMILSLREFHKKGYVHRDIKPSNFVLPLTTYWKHHVYIVDFGLSKKFNYKTCKAQKEAEFIGTSLYASLTAHNKLDLSPIDDLWSLAFVIIDISTNSLPWKPLYIQLENQSKLRRTQVGKLKHEFIQRMLSNNHNNTNSYKMPQEYREFICTLNKTKYNEVPKYNQLIRILRSIALNDKYNEEQYVADHAPLIIDKPIYTNFDILNDKLCSDKLWSLDSILCREFIENNNYCSSNRPRGSWCNNGYHWTLNDEMHYRNTQEMPQAQTITQNICSAVMQFMECDDSKCDQQHPKCGAKYVWNQTNTFSKNKPTWGELDVSDFIQFGLFPRGINYDRNRINIDNFKQCLNPYVKYKYEHLMNDNDFAQDEIINALFQLNVSQTIRIIKDISSSSSLSNEDKREFIINSTKKALIECKAPPQCRKPQRTIASIQYPALYALCKKSNFNFDDHNVIDVILNRLEEFVRHARGKNIGNINEIINILMSIPSKYAIDVLDEIQNMGLQKISVVQSAIKRACDQKQEWIERLHLKQNQPKYAVPTSAAAAAAAPPPAALIPVSIPASVAVPVADPLHVAAPNANTAAPHHVTANKVKCTKSVTSIGNLGYLDHVISDTKQQATTNYNPQQRNKFNYSRVRSNATNRYTFNTSSCEKNSFKMLIPKKKHLISGSNNHNNNHINNTHRSVAKNIAKKTTKKSKQKNKTKKKKNRNKLKKKIVSKPLIPNTNAMAQDNDGNGDDDEDDDDIVNVKNRNHRKRKRAIDDSSDDDDDDEDESSDSDDDIPIGRKRKRKRNENESGDSGEPNSKKRKFNNDYELCQFYEGIPQRLTRKRNKNISYREEDDEEVNFNKINYISRGNGNMRKTFTEIFGENNLFIASNEVKITYDSIMENNAFAVMREKNIKKAKQEIERDIACDLVAKYKTPLDQSATVVPSVGVTCFKCNADPSDMEWELLLCEYCPDGAAHCSCVDPMYSSVPEGAWACDQCQHDVIVQHRAEYNHIVSAKHNELESKYKHKYKSFTQQQQPQPQPQQQPQLQPQPKSFSNNHPASLFPSFFPIPSMRPTYLAAAAPAAPPPPAPQPQIFDQFLHALNQKTHVQNSNTGTININRLNVTNISCSNFNGGIASNQQSTNRQQYLHSAHGQQQHHGI